jgi:hypothetical protein
MHKINTKIIFRAKIDDKRKINNEIRISFLLTVKFLKSKMFLLVSSVFIPVILPARKYTKYTISFLQ